MARGELENLFERFRARGDVAALSTVFGRTAPELLKLARNLAPDEAAAEDLVQATFVAAIEHAARFDVERELVPWLVGILTNKAKLAQTLRARTPDLERLAEREPIDPALDAELREFVSALDRALERVPRRYRDVLRGHLSEGKRPEQLASELGRAPGTVRVQLHRGLVHLRRALPPGFALGVLVTSARARGLSAIRADVLRHASLATKAAGVSSSLVLGGWIVSTKLAVGSALALVAALGLWFFTRGESAQPELVRAARAPAPIESQRVVSSTDSSAEHDGVRREPAPEIADETSTSSDDPYGALDIEMVWSDGTAAADLEIECMPFGETQPMQHVVARITDERGRARVERIREGELAIHTLALDCYEHPLEVRRGNETQLRVVLPAGRDVRGRVVDDLGRAVAGASVWVKHGPNPPLAPATLAARTSSDGTFVVRSLLRDRGLASLRIHLSATVAKLGSSSDVAVEVDESGVPAFVQLALRGESAELEGIVLTPSGEPVEGALISVQSANSRTKTHELARWPWIRTRSAADGRFRASGLHRGSADVLVGVASYPLQHENLSLEEGRTNSIEVRLSEGLIARGSFRDESGAAVPDAAIFLEPSDVPYGRDDVWPIFAKADEQANFVLSGISAGKFTLRAERKDGDRWRSVVRDFEAAAGEDVRWDVVFDDGLSIVGRAEDPRGRPLAGWSADAFQVPRIDSTSPAAVLTSSDGSFAITNLRDVPHWVTLTPPGSSTNEWLAKLENVRPSPDVVVLVADEADLPSAFLSGSIVDANGGPIGGASVWASLSARENARNATSDARDGRFRIGPLWRGDYKLSVAVEGTPGTSIEVEGLAPNEERDVGVIALAATGLVEVVLRTVGGEPLELPMVMLHGPDGRASILGTEDDVTFRSQALFPGTYRLFPIASNAACEVRELEIRAGETTKAELALRAGRRRTFMFDVSEGDPGLDRVHIVVRDALDRVEFEHHMKLPEPGPHILHGDTASFAIGRHRMEVTADDGRAAAAEFEIPEREDPMRQWEPIRLAFPPKR